LWQAFIHWFTEVINLVYGFTAQIGLPSYGLAIIFMTIAIKIVLFPLTQQQMRSMRAMQEIQPKMKYIQEKYKDDPQLMQQKIMEMYKEHGVNPMGGCLPLLIQMPIFLAFYQSLYKFNYIDTAHKGFLWIPDIAVSVKNALSDPSQSVVALMLLFILPLFSGLTTYLQQRISMVDTKDPTQKTMLYFMPVMMTYITYTVPAGLGLYWVTFNILGIAQQLYVNRSHTKPKAVTVSGTGIEVPAEAEEMSGSIENVSEKMTQRDKGGKEKNAGSNSRKKRKKR
jgi:YidC/Oxa1 family membrane protein insertase